MDRTGQQLRYSTGIINAVALKTDSNLSYCEMYRSKNTCLCMTVEDKERKFGALPECNGMCPKQNINIYIENYEARTNNEKYDLKCDSANLDSYPYYKPLKPESKMGAINNVYFNRNVSAKTRPIYREVPWEGHPNKTDQPRNYPPSNVTCYPYMNNAHNAYNIAEGSSCAKSQIKTNLAPAIENNQMYRGTMEKNKIMINSAAPLPNSSPVGSGPVASSSSCNNLYVAPPFFTVDKFATAEQVEARQNHPQSSQYCQTRQYPSSQRECSTIVYGNDASRDHPAPPREHYFVKTNDMKLAESPDIPLMYVGASIEPIAVDIRNERCHYPIEKEAYNYKTKCIYNYQNEQMANGVEFIKAKANPLPYQQDQYNIANSSTVLDKQNKHSEYSAPVHPKMPFHDAQYQQYQRNPSHTTFPPNRYSVLPPPEKSVIRETRKPNYRELINHVHALRNSTSEDDLNRQIIQRTLNYGQPPKSAQVVSNSQMAPNAAPSPNENYSLPRVQNRTIREQKPPTNPAFPLDLSVKTVKTKADSTENHSNCKVIVTKNGYLPKFNFIPDFSENRAIETNGMTPNPAASHLNSSEVDIKIPIQHIRVENNLSPLAYRVKSELPHEPPMPTVRMMVQPKTGVLGNSTGPPTMMPCVSPVVNQRTVIKQEVVLKRKSPCDIADEKAVCLPKKECLESPPVVAPIPVSSPKCPDVKSAFENFKHAFAAKYNIEQRAARENEQQQNVQTNLVITKKEITDKIEHKPDVSSIIAARIRTKAELKGFTFQETPEICHPKPLSNKENFQCNYDTQSSVQMDEVDLTAWEHACSDFVNQLTNDCKSFHRERKRKNSASKVSAAPSPTEGADSLKVTAPEDSASSEEQLVVVKPEDVVIKTEIDPLPAEAESSLQDNEREIKCNDTTLTQKTDPKDNKLDEQSVQPGPGEQSRSSSPVKEKEEPARDIVDRSQDEEKTETCEKMAATEDQIRSKDSEQKQLKTSPKQMDLTKISVVRLKREKYPSKRYASSENIKFKAKTTEGSNGSKEEPSGSRQNKLGRCFPTLRRRNVSVECTRRRQQSISKAKEICDSKYDTIKTRLRHKRLQTETLEGNKAKKKVRLHRHQKPNERESSNESDKMYLEVYRYKRALKIPPNLITIRNMSTQRISTSLPDLDVDPRTPASKKEQSPGCSSASKAKNVSKSIIDVLHSRVVKSKCPIKGSSQKHSKQSDPPTPKVRVQQPCNSTELNIENLCGNSNDSTQREHRNVFETQVLTSRTRREYKMQLNKEVINEIFCGSERPASAPPEVNNFNMDNELSFEKTYKKCFDFTEKDVESAIDQDNNLKEFIMCLDIKKEKDAEEAENGEQTKDSGVNKSVVPRKCKRFRNGRPYRRKFSSGFDYLRKRKKPTTPALYSYPHRKNKLEEEEEETNYKVKSEEDVLREIQKWVLNKGVGQSTLHKAARLGYLDVIVYCLEKMGLNPDHKDNAGYTPLHDACVNGSLEIARVLLQYGANHSEGAHSGIRPLHEASENGHIEIVRMLLSYGADPLLETYAGQTPLMLASDDEMNTFISMHLLDAQANGRSKNPWRFPGPWKIIDDTENGYNIFKDVSSFSSLESIPSDDGKMCFEDKNDIVANDDQCVQKDTNDFVSNINAIKRFDSQIRSLKNDVCEFEILVDSADAEAELFEFEEANMPLPPLYLLKDEGVEKWVLLSDLCSLLKVKSKDTLLHKIFPSISPATVSRTLVRELKMCEFLEKATCLQLLCAGEKINICHSKVVLVRYNENVRKLLGVKTIFMKL